MRRAELIASLRSFDPPTVIESVVGDLRSRGWIEQSSELRLTSDGARKQAALAPLVNGVRHQIGAALERDEYVTLVGLLARLVAALQPQETRPAREGIESR